MSIKFIKNNLKTKDKEDLHEIIQDIKTNVNKSSYSKEARILKQFILAILKTYQPKGTMVPLFKNERVKRTSFKEFEAMRKGVSIKVPKHIGFRLNAPNYIKFNLPRLGKLMPKAPSKLEFDDAPKKIDL